MDQGRYRIVMTALIAGLAAVVLASALLYRRGEPSILPAPLEAVFPLPGDVVVRQAPVEIDLPVGYEILDLVVDGVAVPMSQIAFTAATGDWSWRPYAGDEWGAGDHTVSVRWDRTAGGSPDPGDYTWTFRVG